MLYVRRLTLLTVLLSLLLIAVWLVPRFLNPTPPSREEAERDRHWIDSSNNFIDRQLCRWLSLCGIMHVKWDAPVHPVDADFDANFKIDLRKRGFPIQEEQRPFAIRAGKESWEEAPLQNTRLSKRGHDGREVREVEGRKTLQEIPDYVLDHAPLVHLFSKEFFWPADIGVHIEHMLPYQDGDALNSSVPMQLAKLGLLNSDKEAASIFLTSADDVEARPAWLYSDKGMPTPLDDHDGGRGGDVKPPGWHDERPPRDGTSWWDADRQHPPKRIADPARNHAHQRRPSRPGAGQLHKRWQNAGGKPVGYDQTGRQAEALAEPQAGGYSQAPAVLVLVDKGSGILDAFWFFFYSYNLGQTVLKIRFGNHVGDWEHCMVRFQHGVPRAMFLSEHAGGQAYAWQALEKRRQEDGKPARPVIYSAVGSHAMYATPGSHPYVLPFQLLKDVTDKGPLWDPAQNRYAYWFDYELDREEARNRTDSEPASLAPASSNPHLPTSWFHFDGFWGDDLYELSDKRQWRLFGQYHYVQGPDGPKSKFLDRRKVCQTERCTILYSIDAGKKAKWYS